MNWTEVLLHYSKPALSTFFLTLLFVALALKIFPGLRLMDRPEKYGHKRRPIPYYGGLVIYLAFLLAVLIFVQLNLSVIGLLLGATVIMVLGFFDDLLGLPPVIRIVVQFLAALILVFSGIGILSINVPFLGILDFTRPVFNGIVVASALFTILWVMTIVNVMNFVDGISGLSSGVAFIAGLTMFFLSIHPTLHADPKSQVVVATISLILAFAGLAFLLFDFPKPKILMGDTGSTFLGFVIATLAIFSGGKVATAFLVLGIPILDMVWVVLRRVFSGQKFWKGDFKHLHHRLLSIGFSERRVVTLYLFITAFFGLTAVLLVSSQQKFFMIIALAVLMSLLAAALVLIPNRK